MYIPIKLLLSFLEISNFTLFDTIYVLEYFGNVRNIKSQEVFELLTYLFEVTL